MHFGPLFWVPIIYCQNKNSVRLLELGFHLRKNRWKRARVLDIPWRSVPLSLLNTWTVFRVEINAINEAAKSVSQLSFCISFIWYIYVDSLKAIKILNLSIVKSKCLYDWIQSLVLLNYHQFSCLGSGTQLQKGQWKGRCMCSSRIIFRWNHGM